MSNSLKVSRMELRLREEISAAHDPSIVGSKLAELAGYWARLGRFSDAREQLKFLRSAFQRDPNISVSSAVHLADGLIDHFTDMRESGRQKIIRAFALSEAGGFLPGMAISSAWLAQLDYSRMKYDSMIKHLSNAFNFSDEASHATRYRSALVVAQSYHFAGRSAVAKKWYTYAHSHAVADNDDAAISALMHNMTWLRFYELRAAVFVRGNETRKLGLIEVDSIFNYDKIIGCTSLSSLVAVLRAQILTASGDYSDALSIFERETSLAVEQGLARLQSDWMADQAWCRLNIGQVDLARRDIHQAEISIAMTNFDDDLAFSHSRVSQVLEGLQETARSQSHKEFAIAAWRRHLVVQDSLRIQMERWSDSDIIKGMEL